MSTIRSTIAIGVLIGSVLPGFVQAQEPTRLIESTQGRSLFKAYCAVCHGEDGKGGGPMATHLKVKPSDLTRISARNGGKFPQVKMEKIISGEDALPAGHGTREMPIWGPIFSQVNWDQDKGPLRIANVAKYIEEIQK